MVKRKAEDAPGEDNVSAAVTPKKKSKKERLEEAIAKAKKDMEQDKKKVQSTIQKRINEGKTVSANIKIPIPVKAVADAPTKVTALNSKQVTVDRDSATAKPVAQQQAASTTSELSPSFLPSAIEKVSSSSPPSFAQNQAPAATMQNPSYYPVPPFAPNPVTSAEAMAVQFQLYQNAMAQTGGLYPQQFFQQQTMPVYYPQMNTPAAVTSQPAASASPAAIVTKHSKAKTASASVVSKQTQHRSQKPLDSDDDSSETPSPPTLREQVSMQVLENVQASLHNRPSPHTRPPQTNMSSAQLVGVTQAELDAFDPNYEDSDPINMDPTPLSAPVPTKGPRFTIWISGIIAVAAILSSVCSSGNETLPPPIPKTSSILLEKSSIGVCFLDSDARYRTQKVVVPNDVDHEDAPVTTYQVLINPCEHVENAQPCPPLTTCSDGKVTGCNHSDYELDATGSNCAVKSDVRNHVDKWAALLESLSMQQLCFDPESQIPVFDYLRVIEDKSMPPMSIEVLKTFFHHEQDDDGKLWLGLMDGQPVRISMTCHLQHGLKSFFQSVYEWTISFTWALITGFFMYASRTFIAYPKESLIGTVVVGVYYWYATFKASKRQLIIDTATMRDMALDKLRNASDESHYIMALRDDVIADLTPYDLSDKKRKYYRSQIWPRVMGQLVGDNRLRQTQHMDATKQQVKLYYQWVASKSAKKTVRMADQ